MIRLWQTLWLFISTSLSVHAQVDLDDPEVSEEIIAQAIEVTVEKKPDGSFVFYEPFARLPYKGTGWVVIYYDDGITLLYLGILKNGKPDGLSTFWYENGQKDKELNFKDGKREGLVTQWYDNGQKSGEANFKVGKMQYGIKWQPNGEICPVTNVKDGNGISVHYNEDGTEKKRIYWKDGVEIEAKEQGEIKADARISSDELDKTFLDSIGESPPPLAPPPPIP